MQRSTLKAVLARLPLLLRNRYSGNADEKWVAMYNNLLGELELTGCGPYNTLMVPVPYQMIQSGEVLLPHGICDVLNIFRSTGGAVTWESLGRGAHLLEETPVESQVVAMNLFTGRRHRVGRDILHLNGTAGDAGTGDAIVVHAAQGNSQPGEYNPTTSPKASWIASYLPGPEYQGLEGLSVGLPMEDGEYDWPIDEATDFYWVFRDFLIVEGHRSFRRITTSDDLVSLPPEWDSLTEAYLRFNGEVQTDQTSKDTADWGSIWSRRLKSWMAANTRQAHAAKKPSALPRITLNTSR